MRVTCKLYGNLRRYSPVGQESNVVELPAGATINSLLESLGVPDASYWMAAVNDRVVQPDAVLDEGDLVEFFEPVGGG